MEVSSQLHAPATLPPGKEPLLPIGYEAGWASEPFGTRWCREKFPAPARNGTLEPRSEELSLKKLNDVAFKEQYQVKISNRFPALENFDDDDVDISRAWENIRENLKASSTECLGYY
jgi:hypothetical protein